MTDIEALWPLPEGLCSDGLRAATTIRSFLSDEGLADHGGDSRFFTPEEWRARGEEYGLNSVLVVVHEGGDPSLIFDPSYGQHGVQERLNAALAAQGLFVEPCTNWYSAVYRI